MKSWPTVIAISNPAPSNPRIFASATSAVKIGAVTAKVPAQKPWQNEIYKSF